MGPTVGHLVTVTTDGVPPREQLGYWRDVVLNRNRPLVPHDGQSFRARLVRLQGHETELVEHASDALESDRSPRRSHFTGGEDIAIELMRWCRSAVLEHNGEHQLGAQDLYVVDYSQTLRTRRSMHRAGGIVLSRKRVIEAIGRDPAALAACRLPARGLGTVLRHHLQASIDEAAAMTLAERAAAVDAAADMALALLQSVAGRRLDEDGLGGGLYAAARRLIAARCGEPDLSPEQVALALGCSRATLYRLFAQHDETVADVLWAARLQRARTLLTSADGAGMTVSDVAADCGFRDLSTFSRMYRRGFGLSPSEARRVTP